MNTFYHFIHNYNFVVTLVAVVVFDICALLAIGYGIMLPIHDAKLGILGGIAIELLTITATIVIGIADVVIVGAIDELYERSLYYDYR